MARAQHSVEYRDIPGFLRSLRERANLTQRALGQRLHRPQSWIYNCEVKNRRVDVAEFSAWCKACDVDPAASLAQLLANSSTGRTASHGRRQAKRR